LGSHQPEDFHLQVEAPWQFVWLFMLDALLQAEYSPQNPPWLFQVQPSMALHAVSLPPTSGLKHPAWQLLHIGSHLHTPSAAHPMALFCLKQSSILFSHHIPAEYHAQSGLAAQPTLEE
jgi:hypothetical protein